MNRAVQKTSGKSQRAPFRIFSREYSLFSETPGSVALALAVAIVVGVTLSAGFFTTDTVRAEETPMSGAVEPADVVSLGNDDNCRKCHFDAERLRTLSARWALVYIDEASYTRDLHGRFSCITCHEGEPGLDTTKACVGVAIKDPTDPKVVDKTCGSCHPGITKRFQSSLHNTVDGHRLSLEQILGPEETKKRLDRGCGSCHATCGKCHFRRVLPSGKVVPAVTTHALTARPETRVCADCHGQTGDTYMGIPGQRAPSVMYQAGLQCYDCHRDPEIHGFGKPAGFIADTPTPVCDDCHRKPAQLMSLRGVAVSPPQYDPLQPAHKMHGDTLDCTACHTQWYYNCWDCHNNVVRTKVGDQFYLGINPDTGKVQTAVHSPVSESYGNKIPGRIGGWAIKVRHSLGESQSCERCHLDKTVYITGEARQGPFIGVWSKQYKPARFVPEETVSLIVLDNEKWKADKVHGNLKCADCHNDLSDRPCETCHDNLQKRGKLTGKTKIPPPPKGDWSRIPYIAVQEGLTRVKSILAEEERPNGKGLPRKLQSYREDYDRLRTLYLKIGKEFHGDPGGTQPKMIALRNEVASLLRGLKAVTGRATESRSSVISGGDHGNSGLHGVNPGPSLAIAGILVAIAGGGAVAARAGRRSTNGGVSKWRIR